MRELSSSTENQLVLPSQPTISVQSAGSRGGAWFCFSSDVLIVASILKDNFTEHRKENQHFEVVLLQPGFNCTF